MSLFRPEALAHNTNRLHGSIRIGLPTSWQVVGFFLFGSVAAVAAFLSLASYARVEVASGTIVLDRGVAPIAATRAGVVASVDVREGQLVDAGAALARISAQETLAAGGSAPERTLKAIDAQGAGLADQSSLTLQAAKVGEARLQAQIAGLRQELASLGEQISVQQELVATAAKELETVQAVARNGYISRRDVLIREEGLLSRRQALSQLNQSRAAKQATLAEAQREIGEARAQAQAQVASLRASQAVLEQSRASAEAGEGYIVTAPFRGRVTAIGVRPGQPAGVAQPLMTVVPVDAVPRVELHVPSDAIGFVRVGQDVRIAIDAFPYQSFGTLPAKIADVAGATVPREDAGGQTRPVYLVTATLPRPWVAAFGSRQPLVPGMTLSARIVTEKQSLIRWLFQPAYALGNR